MANESSLDHLSTQPVQQFLADLRAGKHHSGAFPAKQDTPRAALMATLLMALVEKGVTRVSVSDLITFIQLLGLTAEFAKHANTEDPHAFRRAIGDVLGNHGLCVPHQVEGGTKWFYLKPWHQTFGKVGETAVAQ
jgi:hypothetical protein